MTDRAPFAGPVIGAQRVSLLAPDARDAWLERAQAGAAWIDAADVYGAAPGDAERWLARAAQATRVATKGGLVRDGARWLPDGRPRALEDAAAASRDRLGVDALALWQWHAEDPRVELRRSLAGIARVADRGLARAIGLCNVRVGTLRAALDHFPVAVVQVELSPLRPASVRSGIIEEARARGIPVWVYRPLGGADGARKLLRLPGVVRLAQDLATTPAALVLRWLVDLGLEPLPGPSTVDHLDECLTIDRTPLDPVARAALDAAFEPGRLRAPRATRAPPADAPGEVVVIMGTPGAGKSTRIAVYPDHVRLNRDARGGTLADLARDLDGTLASGARRVVLDNTYPSRASRAEVVEIAWRHGVPARCEWLTTSPDDAEVNVVCRILDATGGLPEPDALARASRRDPAVIPPRALHRFREELEPPEVGEGFVRVDQVAFARAASSATGKIALLDPRDLWTGDPARLLALRDAGFALAVLGWGSANERARTEESAASWAAHVWWCSHPAGPPRCWCRKPLPGLGVVALRTLSADPCRSVALGTSAADRALARKLGVPSLEM